MLSEIIENSERTENPNEPRLMKYAYPSGLVVVLVRNAAAKKGIVIYTESNNWEIGEYTGLHGFSSFQGSIKLSS